MKKWVLILIVLGIMLVAIAIPGVNSQAENEYPRDPEAEWDVLTEINRWRIRIGLNPLTRNADLDNLAYTQAAYKVLQAPFTSGNVNFHADQYGYGVIRRAELYGWPGYDSPERVLVGEIAAYYPDVSGMMNFWQTSRIHTEAALDRGFREAGIAVIRNKSWLLGYVVLGGRPGVLPVMYDPVRRMLHLSIDKSYYTDEFVPIRVQLLTPEGTRLHDEEWLIWAERMPLPPNAPNDIVVVMTNGLLTVQTTINLDAARVYPSDPTPVPTAIPTATPTRTPSPFTPTPILPTATPMPTSTPRDVAFDMLITYNDTSFALINQSERNIDLLPLMIFSQPINKSFTGAWLGAYSQIPLETFPPRRCVQAWSFAITRIPPPLPDGCDVRLSGRSRITRDNRFWLGDYFDVYYNGDWMVRCFRGRGLCEFDLPRPS